MSITQSDGYSKGGRSDHGRNRGRNDRYHRPGRSETLTTVEEGVIPREGGAVSLGQRATIVAVEEGAILSEEGTSST